MIETGKVVIRYPNTTVTEIEEAIDKLSPEEQNRLAEWLNSKLTVDIPAMLAALDEGIRSLESEPSVPLEEVREKIDT